MKKIYAMAGFILLNAAVQAQNVIDFESYNLAPESYDNGQNANGYFDFNGTTLTNTYTVDTVWGDYWSGFAISNVTDDTTAGEQYGNYTASGANGSSNFAVFSYDGVINTNAATVQIDSFKITNNTYAAISMRDGDFFGKQFGSPNDANGNPDGTNGEDFFRVWVIGESFDGSQRDSVEFYLADYRFANNSQDYILDTWETIDLTGFGFAVAQVEFLLESSDVGMWGMNTPAYFAIDDIAQSGNVSIKENSLTDVSVYPNPFNDVLKVKGESGTLSISDASGRLVYSADHYGTSIIDASQFKSGMYLISLVNSNGTFTTRIVK